ncbi:MAG: electron transfer flavoprotein subunit alpha/FixB family protein [Ilumatobacteraceae bacterium]
MTATILVVVEHDRGTLAAASREAMAAARRAAAESDAADDIAALTIGAKADGLADELIALGADAVLQAHHDVLADYGPEAWGEVVVQAVAMVRPSLVLASGTDRGNEVLAQAGARLDVPMVANCAMWAANGDGGLDVTRVRWGGSLLEEATVSAPVLLVSVAVHSIDGATTNPSDRGEVSVFEPELDPTLARSVVRDRVERVAGITLATAPVVVGGGRGVGSADGFAPLQELAGLLGGVVGCSRAVTNNGWRNHTDQVGQTGTRIAPTVYLACGISGAIQHWVGAMAAKNIIAINTDPEANMVQKAGYAVIGDLHEVVPAISAEIRRRRGER